MVDQATAGCVAEPVFQDTMPEMPSGPLARVARAMGAVLDSAQDLTDGGPSAGLVNLSSSYQHHAKASTMHMVAERVHYKADSTWTRVNAALGLVIHLRSRVHTFQATQRCTAHGWPPEIQFVP